MGGGERTYNVCADVAFGWVGPGRFGSGQVRSGQVRSGQASEGGGLDAGYGGGCNLLYVVVYST